MHRDGAVISDQGEVRFVQVDHRPVPAVRMRQTYRMAAAFVIDNAVRTTIGHTPPIGADQPPTDSTVGEIRRPRAA